VADATGCPLSARVTVPSTVPAWSPQLARQRAVRERVNCTITFNQVVDGVVYDYVVFVDADNDLEYDAGATGDGFDNNYDGNVDESGESEFILTKVLLSDHYGGVSFDIAKGEGDGLTFTNNDDGIPAVAFSPDGLTKTNSGGFGAGTTFFINTNCKETQTVVSSLGGVRVE